MATDSTNGSYVATDVLCESFFAKADFGKYRLEPSPGISGAHRDNPAGYTCKGGLFYRCGLVKLSAHGTSGLEVIAGLRRRNWIIGAPAVLLGKKYSFTRHRTGRLQN